MKNAINPIINKLIDWIRQHQVTAFFTITFMISWGLGYTWILVVNKGIYLLAPLTAIASCGPSLAGIIISSLSNSQPKEGKNTVSGSPSFLPGLCV